MVDEGVNYPVAKALVLDEGSEFVEAEEEFKSAFRYRFTLFAFELWKRGRAFV